MIDQPPLPPARLFTTFGTVIFVDPTTGELRHGPIESSPENVVLVPHTSLGAPHRLGCLLYESEGLRKPIAFLAGQFHVIDPAEGDDGLTGAAEVEIVSLERGLIALKCDGMFLTAEPAGRIDGSRPWCRLWEMFLASEDWCGADPEGTAEQSEHEINRRQVANFIIDPRLRAQVNTKSSATKVLIYGYPRWSHGRVYYDLCKHLYDKGYIVDIVDWQVNHAEYFADLNLFYDFIMTAPDGVRTLADSYRVPYEKMIVVSHHELDIRMLIEQKGIEVFDKFASYGVVSQSVYCASLMQGVRRPPMVASLGINFAEFYSDLPDRLETVGYASSMSTITFGVEWKRGHLAETAAHDAGLTFKVAGSTKCQMSFHDMPDFYRSVDAVLTSSISESGPLPVMEAAAAGRLVIGTPVGVFPLKAYQGGGIIAPIEAEKFKAFVATTLRHYQQNPDEYVAKCRSIQEAARKFDWKYSIGEWIDLIEAAKTLRPPCLNALSGSDLDLQDPSTGDCEFSTDWFSHHIPVWNELLDHLKPSRLLEIGSFEGRSTCHLIETCSKYGPIEICCIDTWEGGVEHDQNAMPAVERRFNRNIAIACARAHFAVKMRKYRTTSTNALVELLASKEPLFDFVYVDGSHQAPDVLSDAVLAFQLLRVGGVMIFDDYLWHQEESGRQDPLNMPKQAIDSFVNMFQRKLRIMSGRPIYQLHIEKLFP